jgi:hypothetical protein
MRCQLVPSGLTNAWTNRDERAANASDLTRPASDAADIGTYCLSIDEHPAGLTPESAQDRFAGFLDHHVVSFLLANGEFVAPRLVKSKHPPITHGTGSVNVDPELSEPLIEVEVDRLPFGRTNSNGEIHGSPAR